LHEIFTSHYLQPKTERYGEDKFGNFGCFYGYSDVLQSVLAPPGKRLYSPAAELIKRQADREDVPFTSVMEAELLVLLMAFGSTDVRSALSSAAPKFASTQQQFVRLFALYERSHCHPVHGICMPGLRCGSQIFAHLVVDALWCAEAPQNQIGEICLRLHIALIYIGLPKIDDCLPTIAVEQGLCRS